MLGRRGRNAQAERALAARDALIESFYAVDRAQRDLRARVDAAATLDPQGPGGRLRAEFAPLDRAADVLGAAYLAAIDAHPLDEDDVPGAPGAAERDFEAVLERMRRCSAELDAFAARSAAPLAVVDAALAQLPPRVAAARSALAAAREAVARLAADGLAPGSAGELLAAAEQDAARLDGGAARLGVAAAVELADRVAAQADRARAAAEELPSRREAVRRRLSSLRTRADAVEHRLAGVGPALSALRRGFVASSWHDVEAALPGAAERVRQARDLLDDAARAGRAGESAEAEAAVAAAADALDQAEEAVTGVGRRRERLEAAVADPTAPLKAARFAVRDAQRLALAGGEPLPQRWVQALDALALRLDRAAESVQDRPHPDWEAYLRELEAVAAGAASVVGEIRAARAR
ncbi:molecular chaperone DnaJ [Motilibacter aurantiacus]|uniref:molecular chaperone DnaJ n=1 Tax=Motilibacter aurantiacus TaxID=2714955 RepID=UPI00140B05EA|nr:molecular chaperone DnaJ [Motilibacter aurantiacus]NHC43692.1 molecular chaperone DnaJ [Motilibacter aurantiacus]